MTDIVEVGGAGPLLAASYTDVMAPSFAPSELTSLASLEAGLARDDTSVVAAVDEAGAPLAVAVGEWSAATGVVLLAYLAVRPGLRAAGLGGPLLDHVTRAWQDRWQPALLLAEIEHPAAHAASEAYGDPAKRIRFYHRHGVRPLNVPYFQPSLEAGLSRVYGIMLCVVSSTPAAAGATPDTVDGDRLRRFMTEYLVGCEGSVGSDPTTAAFFASLDRPDGVPMVSMEDTATIAYTTAPDA
jgi:GNAT superfamily N-acetyltransferase